VSNYILDMLNIRHATQEDAALLAFIGAETFFDTFARDNSPENIGFYLSTSFSTEIQAAELADPASTFLIAELNGETVGYAHLKTGSVPANVSGVRPLELARIYARTPWIGQGVGAALMQACLSEAEKMGCDTIWLGVWEHNPRAISFYTQWGFEQVGTQIFQLGNDPQTDWVMVRKISRK